MHETADTARQLPCAISWVAPLRHRYHVSVAGVVIGSAQSGDAARAMMMLGVPGQARGAGCKVYDSATGELLEWVSGVLEGG